MFGKKNDVFKIVSKTVGGWDRGYYILDKNFNILSTGPESYGDYDVTITISNDNASYLAVNENINIDNFLFYFISKGLEETNANLEETNANLLKILNGSPFTISEQIEGNVQQGLYNKDTGKYEDLSNYYRYGIFSVSPGEVYAVTGVSWNNQKYPLVSFLNNDNVFLSVLFNNNTKTDIDFTDFIFIVPYNNEISKIIVNGSRNYVPTLKKTLAYKAPQFIEFEEQIKEINTALEETNTASEETKWFNKSIIDSIIDEQKKNPFEWRTFDKGIIVFTFDDSLNDIDLVEQLSENYKVPVCYAAIPSKMNNITTATGGNKTVKEVLVQAQLFGNEILCHGSGALNEDSTDDDIYNVFVKNKQNLESYGFIVNGIIEIGSGGGEKTFDSKRAEKYLRTLYRYSDLYGRNLNLPNYYNPRTYIKRDKEANHNIVDNYVTNKTLLIFATHSITDSGDSAISTSQDILEDLMTYVKTKDVYLLTFKDVYDKFRSSKFENILFNT